MLFSDRKKGSGMWYSKVDADRPGEARRTIASRYFALLQCMAVAQSEIDTLEKQVANMRPKKGPDYEEAINEINETNDWLKTWFKEYEELVQQHPWVLKITEDYAG